MRERWDERIQLDYRYWMSDGVGSDEEMWQAGKRDFELLLEGLLEHASDKTALDIGCGVGRLMKQAAAHFEKVVGIDVSEKAIEKAEALLKECSNVELVLGDGLELKEVKTDSIDIAYSFAALGTMPVRSTAGYLIELNRVLKLGGIARFQLYLGTPQETVEQDTLAIRTFTEENFKAALVACGFETEYTKEFILDYEVSDKEKGIIASLASARLVTKSAPNIEEITQLLLPTGEKAATADWSGSQYAYLMAVARAMQQIKQQNFEAALSALELAARNYKDADENVHRGIEELRIMIKQQQD